MRVKGGTVTRARRKRVMKLAKGYRGAKSRLFKTAKDQVMKSYVTLSVIGRSTSVSSVNSGLPGSTLLPG